MIQYMSNCVLVRQQGGGNDARTTSVCNSVTEQDNRCTMRALSYTAHGGGINEGELENS